MALERMVLRICLALFTAAGLAVLLQSRPSLADDDTPDAGLCQLPPGHPPVRCDGPEAAPRLPPGHPEIELPPGHPDVRSGDRPFLQRGHPPIRATVEPFPVQTFVL